MPSHARARLAFAAALVILLGVLSSAPAGFQGRGGRGGAPPPGGSQAGTPRDPGGQVADPTGTSRITGVVTVAGAGVPARRTRIMLSGGGLRRSRTTTTDDDGRFVLGDLAAGRYTLSASRTGYVSVTYGQRQPGPGRPGTPIQLADGQAVTLALQIPRGAVISGTVLDEAGEAIPGTMVRVYRYTMQSGVRTLQAGGSDSTDDRGVYRIYGLQPGEYLVCATPRSGVVVGRAVERLEALAVAGREAAAGAVMRLGLPEDSDGNGGGYAPVFYPGTTLASTALSVPAGAGEERLGVDFQLQLVPMATIEGVVIAPDGQALQGLQVRLINTGDEVSGLGNSAARPDREGRFRLTNVAPGHYTLVARSGGGGRGGPAAALLGGRGGRGGRETEAPAEAEAGRMWALADLTVDGRDIPGVVLTMQPGLTLSGRVEFGGGVQPPADLTRVRVSLVPADTAPAARELATAANGRVDENGRFTITGVVPGRYRLAGTAPGTTVQSATVAGLETLDFPVDIRDPQGLSGAVVTFGASLASLSGIVADDQGRPVSDYMLIVYPTDSRYWLPQARRIRAVRPGTDGSYTIDRLPPGDYRIAPIADPEPGAWYDPAFLQQIDAAAMRVTVSDGEKKVQNVRLSGA